jgi:hypothetical protein
MKQDDNFLDYIPVRAIDSGETADGHVYLIKEKTRRPLLKKLIAMLGRSQTIQIHLDAQSSDAWRATDGLATIAAIAERLRHKHGAAAEPCYERTARYFAILKSNGFISFKSE